MSIINDALKKTQENMETNSNNNSDVSKIYEKMHQTKTPTQNTQDQGPTDPKAKKKSTSRVKDFFTLVFLFFLTASSIGYCAYYIIKENAKNNHKPLPTFKMPSIAIMSPKKNKRPTPPPPKQYTEHDLVLNGIITIDNTNVALINDKIYKLGEEVYNKKIVSITSDEVKLVDEANITTTLNVRH